MQLFVYRASIVLAYAAMLVTVLAFPLNYGVSAVALAVVALGYLLATIVSPTA